MTMCYMLYVFHNIQNAQPTAANNAKATQNAAKANVAGLLKTNSGSNIVVGATTAASNKKPKNTTNVKQQKSAANADEGSNQTYKKSDDEFGAWCTKALSAHVDVIDGRP